MANHEDSIASEQVLAKSARQRVSVDLRSLGPMVHAQAVARGLALSALIRLAVSSFLETSPDSVASAIPSVTDKTDIKVTLRLRCDLARLLARRAKCSGLSYGGYVAMLLNSINPSMAKDLESAVDTLGRSTALLAPALADLKDVARCAGSPPDGLGAHQIDALAQALHRHLLLAATLLAELRPVAVGRRRSKPVR